VFDNRPFQNRTNVPFF